MDHSTHSSKRTDRAALPQAEASRAELEHGNNALTEDGVPAEHFARVRGPVSKLKHILHLHKVKQDAGDSGDLPVLANVQDTSESKSSRSRLDHEDTHSQSKSSKVHDLLHDPIKATKSTIQDLVAGNVAENMLATEIPHDHDVNLIESQDAVLQAKTSEDRLKATYKRDELVENRQNEFVRWTLDRHVTRVKVVSNDALPDRQKKDYQRTDKQGRVKTDWMSYCAHVSTLCGDTTTSAPASGHSKLILYRLHAGMRSAMDVDTLAMRIVLHQPPKELSQQVSRESW